MKQVIKISQVKNNPNNPRVIKDHDFYVLVNSIKTTPGFMEFRPVIIDYNNMVLCGNQRLRACIYLGHKEIWTDLFTQEKADEMNKEAQKEGRPTKTYLEYCKAITIVDNTHAGTWDWDILANEWEQTELEGWGLDGFPFEDKTLEAEEDDFAVPDEIKTDIVIGDLFEIGEHRLLCGDSTCSDTVAKLMNGEKADMVFTDPPYGIGFEYNSHKDTKGEEYLKFCDEWFANLQLVSDFIFISTGWYYQKFWWNKDPKDCFYWLSKNKRTGGSISHFRKVEPLFIWGKPKNKYNFDFFEQVTEIIEELKGKHTCPKPITLISDIIKAVNEKDLICDIFLGSGTTMVAAHQLKRKCYGMELDAKYCQVIIDRMKKLDPNLVIKRNGINIE
jgi:DNA modification methylase